MKLLYLIILTLGTVSAKAQALFHLARPYVQFQTVFFDDTLSVPVVFNHPGAQIRYTLNQSTPSEKSKLYKSPLVIRESNTTLKVRAFAKGFLPSETEEITFIKKGRPIVVHFPSPDKSYPGTGPSSLTDNLGGIADPNQPGWLGYRNDSVSFTIEKGDQLPIKEVLIDLLQDQGAWIFFPQKMAMYTWNDLSNNWQHYRTISLPSYQTTTASCKPFKLQLPGTQTKQLKLVVFNQPLPTWHPGAGANSWIFIDEIKVY